MSTSKAHIDEMQASKTYALINRSIKTINVADFAQENAVLPQTLSGNVQRLVKIYAGVKPLLTVIATLPLIPQTWRAAIALFNSALDAVAATSDVATATATDAPPDFKVGKDL